VRYQLFAACFTGAVLGVPSLSLAAPTYQVLHDFTTKAAGVDPIGGVLPAPNGNLYGVMLEGGSDGDGLAYALVPATGTGKPRQIVVHNFTGGSDGAFPLTGFAMNAAGVLFAGVDASGGGQGTLYSLTPTNKRGTTFTLASLFTFGGTNGDGPEGAPVIGADGALYGVTVFGGSTNFGTIWQLSPPAAGQTAWTQTVLGNFTGTNGKFPQAGLIQGPGGVFYGTTTEGGAHNAGIVFQIAPPTGTEKKWHETILHSFAGGKDGVNPFDAGVSVDASGALFGTTTLGGSFGQGVAYKLTPPAAGSTHWTETILHTFGGGSDGEGPLSKIAIGNDGTLYGTLSEGGTSNLGLVYSLTPAAHGTYTYQTLHAFTGGKDGGNPFGDLSVNTAGTIFGTTDGDSTHGIGTIFSITP
jgi:uncharacterized repeat protein (TIGR03803 family)